MAAISRLARSSALKNIMAMENVLLTIPENIYVFAFIIAPRLALINRLSSNAYREK